MKFDVFFEIFSNFSKKPAPCSCNCFLKKYCSPHRIFYSLSLTHKKFAPVRVRMFLPFFNPWRLFTLVLRLDVNLFIFENLVTASHIKKIFLFTAFWNLTLWIYFKRWTLAESNSEVRLPFLFLNPIWNKLDLSFWWYRPLNIYYTILEKNNAHP